MPPPDFQTEFTEILAQVRAYNPQINCERLTNAFEFGAKCHQNQQRFSGEPYFLHPIAATKILLALKPDEDTIIACLLHDVVEDTSVKITVIEKNFGKVVAKLCAGLEKIGKVQFQGQERQIENLRKMFVAMSQDLRVIFIKLADRLHNLATLAHVRNDKQKRIAKESLEIYAPIAERLGIYEFKSQIEDLAFQFLHPTDFAQLQKAVAGSRARREKLIQAAQQKLQKKLAEQKFAVEITGRTKHFYSLWRKLQIKQCDLSEIYDLFALRVLTDSVADCYAILGAIHTAFRPLSERFKDFIAVAKPNGYQSLHTTVLGLIPGQPVEIQIRTKGMHVQAERGAAAHFQYSEQKKSITPASDKLKWVQNLIEIHEEIRDNREFAASLTSDIFEDRIFVLTPKGDVFDLPTHATPIDFAYLIHTEVGNKCVGAKVNGKIVALASELQDGQVVEILTRKNAKPNRFWLSFVKTNSAAQKIKAYFASLDRAENLVSGKELLNLQLTRLGVEPLDPHYTILKNYKNQNLTKIQREQLLERIGQGSVRPGMVTRDLFKFAELTTKKPQKSVAAALATPQSKNKEVIVEGVSGILTKMAKCCAPNSETPLVAILSRAGARIHRQDCKQVQKVPAERRLFASFTQSDRVTRFMHVLVGGQNRVGFLRDIAAVIAELKINIADLSLKRQDKHTILHELTLEVSNLTKLNVVLGHLAKIPGVTEVRLVSKKIQN